MKVAFKKDRETKNTIRFAEVKQGDKDFAIEALYLKKKALEENGLSGVTDIEVEVRAKS